MDVSHRHKRSDLFHLSKAKKMESESLQNKTIDNPKSDPYFDGDEVQIKLHKAFSTSQKNNN
jgi:hypothetical protein